MSPRLSAEFFDAVQQIQQLEETGTLSCPCHAMLFSERKQPTSQKRAQTFVRFGKRAQTFVRFG